MTLLVYCSISGLVIMGAGLLATLLMRRRSAAIRHFILACAILCAAAAPAARILMPIWEVRTPLIREEATPLLRGEAAAEPPVAGETAFPVFILQPMYQPAADASRSPAGTRISYSEIIMGIWITGVLVSFAVLLTGWTRLAWIATASDRILHGKWVRAAGSIACAYRLRRNVHLVQSRNSAILATWGAIHPRIILPPGAEAWPEDRIQVVLRHELAHVKRHDWFVQTAAEILRAIYWFDPLIWIACSRLRQESEQACDDTVLNCGFAAPEYAAHLLDLARSFRANERAWQPALSMARESTLESRFKALLNPKLNRSAVTRLAIITTLVFLLAITLPVSALHVAAQQIEKLDLPGIVIPAPASLLTLLMKPAPPQNDGSARIEGTVLRYGTEEPLPEAAVELRATGAKSDSRLVTTGGDGRFVFEDVPPGKYQLLAGRIGGYIPAEYGQRTPSTRGLPITLAAGQKLTDIRLNMAQTSSISGHVYDRDGEPVGRAQVQALRTVYEPIQIGGGRTERIVASVPTDDRGEYRLFYLAPGQYRISATPQDVRRGWSPVILSAPDRASFYELHSMPVIARRILETGEVQEEINVPVYFPGSLDIESASLVDLRSGTNLTGVDIRVVPPVLTHHVRGRVMSAVTGRPVANSNVMVQPVGRTGSRIGPVADTNQNGEFDLAGLLPGSYVVSASGSPGDENVSGRVPVAVGNTDVQNISLIVSKGWDIPVRVTVDGQPPSNAGLSLEIRRYPDVMGFGGMVLPPGTPTWNLLASSRFTLPGIKAGDYRITFGPMGGGPGFSLAVYIKSMRMGAQDVLNGLMHVDGPPQAPLEIVIGTNTATFEGTALNDKKETASNIRVTLVPDLPHRGRADLYKTVMTDSVGHFRFTGVAPGAYRAFAWEAMEAVAWEFPEMDPDFLRAYEGRARPVHFEEGTKDSVQLTVIPMGR